MASARTKTCCFVCHHLGLMHASPTAYQSQVIQGPTPQVTATKAGVPGVCTTPPRDATDNMEQVRGRLRVLSGQAVVKALLPMTLGSILQVLLF